MPIIHHPSQLNRAWAERIIHRHIPEGQIKQVKPAQIITGTTTRIRVQVDHSHPEQFPKLWFIKIPSLNWKARVITALPQLLTTEIRFYQQFHGQLPVLTPNPLASVTRLSGSTLVLNDVCEAGYRAGQPEDILTETQIFAFSQQLAKLHAYFWNQVDQNPAFAWLDGSIRQLEDKLGTIMAWPLMKLGLKKAGPLIPDELHAPALNYAKQRKKIMALTSQGNKTLVHHDCHPGNLFWIDSQPGLLDWQMVRIGEGIGDLGYFFATGLEPDQQAVYIKTLIEHYLDHLHQEGIKTPGFKTVQQQFKTHLCYPFEAMTLTLAIGGLMEQKSLQTTLHRCTSAVKLGQAFQSISI
jgi:hypothetical protein